MNKTLNLIFGDVSPDKLIDVPYYKESITKNLNTYVRYGEDNKFPNQLIEIINQSPSASSILSGTIEILKTYEIKQNFELPYSPYINNYHDTFQDLFVQCAYDYLAFGMFFIQITWNKLGNIAELVHVPAEMCRMNEDHTLIFFNKNWAQYSSNSIKYDAYTGNIEENGYSQIYVYTNSGHRRTYGMSQFAAAINDIASEAIAAQYIKNSLDSGLSSRFLLDIPNTANLTDDQKADIETAIKDKFCGAANAGSFMIYFNNSDKALEVKTIDNDNSHERFNAIREAAKNNIFTCVHTTPNLFGSPTQTTGFNEQEYEQAYSLYFKMTILPFLNIFKKVISNIFKNDNVIEINYNNDKQKNNI